MSKQTLKTKKKHTHKHKTRKETPNKSFNVAKVVEQKKKIKHYFEILITF